MTQSTFPQSRSKTPTKSAVMPVDFSEHAKATTPADGHSLSLALLNDVKVKLNMYLGDVEICVQDFLALQTGSILELNKYLNQDIDVQLHGRIIARAEIVAVGEQFGVRITEILTG